MTIFFQTCIDDKDCNRDRANIILTNFNKNNKYMTSFL